MFNRSILAMAVGLLMAVGCGDDSTGGGGSGGSGGAGGGDGGSPSDGGSGAGPAEVNGCTLADADDETGSATVDLEWTLTHQECIRVAVGTTVTWTGAFTTHPLKGGESPDIDASSPITESDQTGADASVTFDTAGEFPYFCNVHFGSMQGVIYVE